MLTNEIVWGLVLVFNFFPFGLSIVSHDKHKHEKSSTRLYKIVIPIHLHSTRSNPVALWIRRTQDPRHDYTMPLEGLGREAPQHHWCLKITQEPKTTWTMTNLWRIDPRDNSPVPPICTDGLVWIFSLSFYL